MPAGKVIGQIEVSVGDIDIIGVDGVVRKPEYNGMVYEGEQIVSSDPNALFQIKYLALPEATAYDGVFRVLADGSVVAGMDEMDSIAGDEDLSGVLETADAGEEPLDALETAAVEEDVAEVETEAGEDVFDLETAAGEEGVDGSSGYIPTDVVADSSVQDFGRGGNPGVLGLGGLVGDEIEDEVRNEAVANPDSAIVDEDNSVVIDVLNNDTITGGTIDSSTVVISSEPANGSVSVNPDGTVTYTPNENFNGNDSFSYTIDDNLGIVSDPATVNVTINPVDDPTVVFGDTVVTDEDVSVNIDVLANDTDIDGPVSEVASVTQGANGSVVINPDGTLTYIPNPDFNGNDSFTYTNSEGTVGSVNVTVNPIDDPTVVLDDTAVTNEDVSVNIDVLANDSDIDSPVASVASVTQGANGSVVLNQDGTVTYVPNSNFNGNDSFTYTNSEGTIGSVNVTVHPVDDPTVVLGDSAVTNEDTSVKIDVLANDTDIDGPVAEVASVTQGTNGSVVINADGTVTYVPGSNFNGSDSFTYTNTEGTVGTVNVTVLPVNDPSVVVDDAAVTDEDVAVDIDVLANDTDIDSAVSPVASVTQGSNGTVAINLDGTVKYTPDADYSGPDSFTYTNTEGNTATVNVYVNPIGDPTVIVDDAAVTDEDVAIDIDVLANDTDIDSAKSPVFSVTQGSDGTVTINPDGTVKYTPDANFHGSDSFTYENTEGNTATVYVTVNPINDAPDTTADALDPVLEGTNLVMPSVLLNDSDVDNLQSELYVSQFATDNNDTLGSGIQDANGSNSTTTALGGTVIMNIDGTFDYTAPVLIHDAADPSTPIEDSFYYKASDGSDDSVWTKVTMDVTDDLATVTSTSAVGSVGDGTYTGTLNISSGADIPAAVLMTLNSVTIAGVAGENLSITSVTPGAGVDYAWEGSFDYDGDTYTFDLELVGNDYTLTLVNPEVVTVDPEEFSSELSGASPAGHYDITYIDTDTGDTFTAILSPIAAGTAITLGSIEATTVGTSVNGSGDGLGIDNNLLQSYFDKGDDKQNPDDDIYTTESFVYDPDADASAVTIYFTGGGNNAFNGDDVLHITVNGTGAGQTQTIVLEASDYPDGIDSYTVDVPSGWSAIDTLQLTAGFTGTEETTVKVAFGFSTVGETVSQEFMMDFTTQVTDNDGDVDAVDFMVVSGIEDGTADSDIITGTSGSDSISGGAGDDTIVYDSNDTIDGGADTDTLLVLDGTLDLSNIGSITNIESIKLGSDAQIVGSITAGDVIDMTDSDNDLIINGDTSGVSVDTTVSGGLTQVADTNVDGVDYNAYTGDSGVMLLIEIPIVEA